MINREKLVLKIFIKRSYCREFGWSYSNAYNMLNSVKELKPNKTFISYFISFNQIEIITK